VNRFSPNMAMDSYDRFHQLLKRDFAPFLRGDGFKGSGTTFRRIKGDAVHLLNIQGSRYGGQCCVNLGVHFSFLPTAGGGSTFDPQRLREYDCDFRERMHDAGESDHWWGYGETEAESQASAVSLIHLYRNQGILFFQKFEQFPEVFERITPAEIDSGDLSKMPAAMTRVRAALTMARVMKHLGRFDKCRQFAEIGLRNLGRGVALKAEFERLLEAG
jgi:hypothetical protein